MPDEKPTESDQLPEEAPEDQVPDDTGRQAHDEAGGGEGKGRGGDEQASGSPKNAG